MRRNQIVAQPPHTSAAQVPVAHSPVAIFPDPFIFILRSRHRTRASDSLNLAAHRGELGSKVPGQSVLRVENCWTHRLRKATRLTLLEPGEELYRRVLDGLLPPRLQTRLVEWAFPPVVDGPIRKRGVGLEITKSDLRRMPPDQ